MPPKAKAKTAAKKPAGRGKGAKNSHQLAPQLPEGTVLKDYTKGEWKLGKPIGSGGFGLIYAASKNGSGTVGPNAEFVVKVEPHQNGPLFCELHFYQRVARADSIKQWMTSHKLKTFGMPKFIAHGAYEDPNEKYRFMVMERFGTDLQKLFEQNGKVFPRKTVLTLGVRLLEVLEYIHSKDYCHADIKAANLLLGFQKSLVNQVYLVDYGLAYRYISDGKHKPYKEDPKWKHNGTIEFTSRDAHTGLTPSRRGDLEILGYCLLQWLCSMLPWEDKLTDPVYVQNQKNKYMDDIPSLMRKCFPSGDVPTEIEKFLKYVKGLNYDEQPDYERCKQILRDGIKSMKLTDDGKLDFTATIKSPVKQRATDKDKKRRVVESSEEEDEVEYIPSPAKRVRKRPEASAAMAASPSPARRGKVATKTPRGRIQNGSASSPDVVSSPALERVRATEVTRPSPGRKGKSQKSPAKVASETSANARVKKTKLPKVNVGCQTSPGLKGLKRSRRGKE